MFSMGTLKTSEAAALLRVCSTTLRREAQA
jgi:hypothetical protein